MTLLALLPLALAAHSPPASTPTVEPLAVTALLSPQLGREARVTPAAVHPRRSARPPRLRGRGARARPAGGLDLRLSAPPLAATAATRLRLAPARPADAAAPPPCLAEVCPAVTLPGHENAYRGRRSDVVLGLLARSPFPRVAAMASALADSTVQLDYRPGGSGRERGWGRVVVSLRWRLDATGPVDDEDQARR